ncbi:MAG: diguanylate cyclase [Erysipelotrichaceae bacterium]
MQENTYHEWMDRLLTAPKFSIPIEEIKTLKWTIILETTKASDATVLAKNYLLLNGIEYYLSNDLGKVKNLDWIATNLSKQEHLLKGYVTFFSALCALEQKHALRFHEEIQLVIDDLTLSAKCKIQCVFRAFSNHATDWLSEEVRYNLLLAYSKLVTTCDVNDAARLYSDLGSLWVRRMENVSIGMYYYEQAWTFVDGDPNVMARIAILKSGAYLYFQQIEQALENFNEIDALLDHPHLLPFVEVQFLSIYMELACLAKREQLMEQIKLRLEALLDAHADQQSQLMLSYLSALGRYYQYHKDVESLHGVLQFWKHFETQVSIQIFYNATVLYLELELEYYLFLQDFKQAKTMALAYLAYASEHNSRWDLRKAYQWLSQLEQTNGDVEQEALYRRKYIQSLSEWKRGQHKLYTQLLLDETGVALLQQRIKEQKSERTMLHSLANTDVLTGLFNRRYLKYYRKTKLNELQTYGLLMIDIDYFKQYNDAYGHSMGDAALMRVSRVLRYATKREDVRIFRYGGEEFLLIVQVETKAQLAHVAQGIQAAMLQEQIEHKHSPFQQNMTLCIGMSMKPKVSNKTYMQVLSQCDDALYLAKKEGRNCIRSIDWRD